MRKYFCLSFHKSGTTSVRDYFRSLGVSCCHGPHRVGGIDYMHKVRPVMDEPERAVDVLTPVIAQFTAHGGVPYQGLYPVLAQRYPDARFILVTRDLDRWWASIDAHWSLGVLDHRMTPFEYIQYRPYLGAGTRTVSRRDRERLIDAHRRHVEAVQRDLPPERLLVCRLEDADKAERFAAFLDLADVHPFPHSKRTDTGRKGRRLLKNIKLRFSA